MSKSIAAAQRALTRLALSYPDTREDHPWGHSAFKVKGKTFLFLYSERDFLSLSVKLPDSGRAALRLPFASPTEYGLGKSGWVTAKFQGQQEIPVEMLSEWTDESFRAIAPKQVLKKLHDVGVAGHAQPATRAKTARPRRS